MQITGGYLKSRKIISPKGSNVRPTLSKTRESLFNVLANLIDFDGSAFLDVFAGSGIMGFEAASRGFDSVDFIEKDRKTFALLKENAKILGVSAGIFCGDALKLLKTISKTYEVIYVDPPYAMGLYDGVVRIIKEENLLKSGGILVLEHPQSLKIDFNGFEIIKQKKYSDKILTFLNKKAAN